MALKLLVQSAERTLFPISHLPFGVASTRSKPSFPVVRVGHHAVNLRTLEQAGVFASVFGESRIFEGPDLGKLMQQSSGKWREVRLRVQEALSEVYSELEPLYGRIAVPLTEARMQLPCAITDYCTLAQTREDIPVLKANRASSVIPSDTPIRRPKGVINSSYQATEQLDFSVELGVLTGGHSTNSGETLSVDSAEDAIFGATLLNNWSARDFEVGQSSFATTVSPWIVTLDSIAEFRASLGRQEKVKASYLTGTAEASSYDVEVWLGIQAEGAERPQKVVQANLLNVPWGLEQLLAQYTSSGCPLRHGTLLSTGPLSGDESNSLCSGQEYSAHGQTLSLNNDDGDPRVWLRDGDIVQVTGACLTDDLQSGPKVGFGDCTGQIHPTLN